MLRPYKRIKNLKNRINSNHEKSLAPYKITLLISWSGVERNLNVKLYVSKENIAFLIIRVGVERAPTVSKLSAYPKGCNLF